jgi:hypothetical protein
MIGFGAVLAALPLAFGVGGAPRVVDIVAGIGIIGTAGAYLCAPTWRTAVVLDQRGLRVVGPRGERLAVGWHEIASVLADEEERAALVRGPAGARSLLLPSAAHPAPYRIEHAEELYTALLAQVPPEKVVRTKVFRDPAA